MKNPGNMLPTRTFATGPWPTTFAGSSSTRVRARRWSSGHITVTWPLRRPHGQEWMGYHLRKMYGTDMVVLGFAFNQGSFQAVQMPFGTGRSASLPCQAGTRRQSGCDARRERTDPGRDRSARVPKDGPVATWFNEPHATRSFGAGYSEQSESSVFLPVEGSTALRRPALRRDNNLGSPKRDGRTSQCPEPGRTRQPGFRERRPGEEAGGLDGLVRDQRSEL